MENEERQFNKILKSENLEMKPSLIYPSDKCDLCDYVPSQASKSTIKIHKETVHFGIKLFCDYCPQKSTTRSNSIRHVKKYHPEMQQKTMIKEESAHIELESDMKKVTENKIGLAKPNRKKRKTQWFDGCDKIEEHCPCCQQSNEDVKKSNKLSALKLPENIKQNTETFKCFFCDLVSIDRLSRDIHIDKEHKRKGRDGISRYQCNYCPYESSHASVICKHESLGHAKTFTFKCEMCIFDTHNKTTLICHLKNTHQIEMQMFKRQPQQITKLQSKQVDTIPKLQGLKQPTQRTPNIKILKCFFCDFASNDRLSRSIHIEKEHEDRKRIGRNGIWRYQCNYCSYESEKAFLIFKHEDLGHKLDFSFECDHCEFIAYNKTSFILHVKSIHQMELQMFKRQPKKIQKQRSITKEPSRTALQCEICTFQTMSATSFGHHRRSHQMGMVICVKCDHKTATKQEMVLHNKIHATGSEAKEISKKACENCGFVPKGERLMRRIKQLYAHFCKPLKCELCTYESHLTHFFDKHIKNKHTSEIKMYKCEICSYQSNRKLNVQKHNKTVHEGFRINCIHCEKKFTQNSDLRHHMDSDHGIEFQKKYRTWRTCATCGHKNKESIFNNHKCEPLKCELCPYETKLEFKLKVHKGREHKEYNEHKEAKEVLYNCDECQYTSKRHMYDITLHKLRVHEGIGKNLDCRKCGNRFLTMFDMKTHFSSVHGITSWEEIIGTNQAEIK